MRIIALITNDSLGLSEEVEILGLNIATAQVLVDLGYAKIYDDTKPLIGKSVNPYQPFSYEIGIQVFNNDSIYKSNCITSATWVPTEWDILVTGRNAI